MDDDEIVEDKTNINEGNEKAESNDDERSDVELEAAKVLFMGKLMGFMVEDDKDLTKALIKINKRKAQ